MRKAQKREDFFCSMHIMNCRRKWCTKGGRFVKKWILDRENRLWRREDLLIIYSGEKNQL